MRPDSRILLLGATGQVGWELARSLQPLGEVIACGRDRADLSDPRVVAPLVREIAPQVVVNAAAWTGVDAAERESDLAMMINGVAPGMLAEAARQTGALFVHYSTDYVFDGSGSEHSIETRQASPINAYGRSKLAGEERIAAAGGNWLVLRTSWVYAARGQNFVRTMLHLGAERELLRVVDDQIGAPTSARLIADATAHIVYRALADCAEGRFRPELMHLCAAGETSWCGFAEAIFEGWRALKGKDSLRLRELLPISTADYPTPAARPLNSRLDCSLVSERYGLRLPDWRVGLALVLEELAVRQ